MIYKLGGLVGCGIASGMRFPRCLVAFGQLLCFTKRPFASQVFNSSFRSHNMVQYRRKTPSFLSTGAPFCSSSNTPSEDQSQESVLKQQMNKLQTEHMSIELKEYDLEEKFIRGGGPGGQSINKTESCVVLVHKPTGIWVKCQESRSQFRNRQIARQRLK